MVARGDRWAVRDVVIDGMSLAANYRAQFTRVIQSSSYPDLVQQLRDKVAAAPPAFIASAAPSVSAKASAPEQAARERPAPALPTETGTTTRDTDVPLGSDAAQSRPSGASTAPTTPGVAAAVTPSGRPRTAAPASREADKLPARSYWVQVAAFKNFEAAMRLASLLRAEKPVPSDRWVVVMEPGPTLARVRIGPFADHAEAASSLRELELRGFKPFIAQEGRDPR